MTAGQIGLEHYAYLATWLFAPIMLFRVQASGGRLPGTLVYAYIVGFFIAHWMGALVHASPSSAFADSTDTVIGFRLSTFALLALLAGAAVVPATPSSGARYRTMVRSVMGTDQALAFATAWVLLLLGIIFWVAPYTPIASIPSTTAVLSAGKHCVLLGVCLSCWLHWQKGDRRRFRRWLALAFMLPVITVMLQGFIGYGITMLGTIMVFVAMFYRPRWRLLAGLAAGLYCGLTLWVAYYAHREQIRSAVWGGQGIEQRVGAIVDMLASIAPFDFSNPAHLAAIDERLNQNSLVGAAVRTTPDYVPYAYGDTLLTAVIAIVPRAIWPEKPAVAGSGDHVARHTLMNFAEGTSVGMGQVLEFYINFGVPAVLVGFFLLGLMLRKMDVALVRGLATGDIKTVQFYFLTGSGALQPGGAVSEIAGTMGAGALLSLAISWGLARWFRSKPVAVRPAVQVGWRGGTNRFR